MKKKIVYGCIFLLFLSLVGAIFYACFQTGENCSFHKPGKELRAKWEGIEDHIGTKDTKTVNAIDTLMHNLVTQENETTVLLEQKASTQMGCISIVVAIILAALGLFLKDLPSFISSKTRGLLIFITSVIVIIFLSSMYWSYKGFVIRDNYATYNVDDLFKIMQEEESSYHTYQVSNILENYQIYTVNDKVNDKKAIALLFAARTFIVGIIVFCFVALGIILLTNKTQGEKNG